MTNVFRIISVLEGLSFITLLGLVYVLNMREYVFVVGMGHGILFLIYFIGSFVISHHKNWSVMVWLMVLLCSVIPFAFIPVEIWLRNSNADTSVQTDAA